MYRHLAVLLGASLLTCYAQEVKPAAGTVISVKTIDRIDSERGQPGDIFKASLTEALVVNGTTLAPAGADAQIKIIETKKAGRLRGKAELAITLVSVTARDQIIELDTENTTSTSGGKGKSTAVKTGIGAGLGAAIGAVAGGGKGAVIGAGAGAAGGAAVSAVTSGPRVTIPPETQLSFTVR